MVPLSPTAIPMAGVGKKMSRRKCVVPLGRGVHWAWAVAKAMHEIRRRVVRIIIGLSGVFPKVGY
jgi:hypothetical protein